MEKSWKQQFKEIGLIILMAVLACGVVGIAGLYTKIIIHFFMFGYNLIG